MTALIALGWFVTGGLLIGFSVFLCMRVVVHRSEKRAEDRVMKLNREVDDERSRKESAIAYGNESLDRIKNMVKDIAELKTQLEAKNTRPPAVKRAANWAEYQQMQRESEAREQK